MNDGAEIQYFCSVPKPAAPVAFGVHLSNCLNFLALCSTCLFEVTTVRIPYRNGKFLVAEAAPTSKSLEDILFSLQLYLYCDTDLYMGLL